MPSDNDRHAKVDLAVEQAIQAIFSDRPIAYHAALAKALESVTAGVLLSQLLYWQPRSQDAEGWFWKTRGEIYEETGLTRFEQEGARKRLVQARVLEEKRRGVPARMHFRVNLKRLIEILSVYHTRQGSPPSGAGPAQPVRQSATQPPSSWRKTSQLDGGKPANQNAGNQPTNTETTAETTTDIINDDVVAALEKFGISARQARRLARNHPPERIYEKLELVAYLEETNSPLVGKSPPGFLVRAIEQDYAKPKGFKTKAEREHEAAAKAEQDRRRQVEEAEFERAQAQRREAIKAFIAGQPAKPIKGTGLDTRTAWGLVLQRLKGQLSALNFNLLLADTFLADCQGGEAVVGVPSRFTARQLETKLTPFLTQALMDVLQVRTPPRLFFEVAQFSPDPEPAPTPSIGPS